MYVLLFGLFCCSLVYFNYITVLSYAALAYTKLYTYYYKDNYQIVSTIPLPSRTVYLIKLLDKKFISHSPIVDISKYKTFIKTISIPKTPDDILDAELTLANGNSLDILPHIQLLCGPFIDQLTAEHTPWIFEYLNKTLPIARITKIEITFVNTAVITLT